MTATPTRLESMESKERKGAKKSMKTKKEQEVRLMHHSNLLSDGGVDLVVLVK